jgi:hypothetical protein
MATTVNKCMPDSMHKRKLLPSNLNFPTVLGDLYHFSTVDLTVVPKVAVILDFNMATITNRAQNDVFYRNFGSTTDTNIFQVAMPRFLGPAHQNGAISDDVTWPPYLISR